MPTLFDPSRRVRARLPHLASLTLAAVLLLSIEAPAWAQKKSVDCSPPRGVSRASEVQALIQEGERSCDQAKEVLKQARSLRDRGEDLRKEAVRYRKTADDERKEIGNLRKLAEDRRKQMDDLREEALDLEAEARRYEDLLPGTFRAELRDDGREDDPSEPAGVVTPPLGRTDSWEASLDAFYEAMVRYTETRSAAIEEEIKALEGMIQMEEELAADREVTAVDLEQLALNSERTAMDAEAAAGYAEDAATVAEEAAVRSFLRASSEFILLNLEQEKAKRNVNRAIGYIEDHLSVLPLDEASEIRDVVARGKEAFDLK